MVGLNLMWVEQTALVASKADVSRKAWRCNIAIGLLGDSPKIIDDAAAYLRKHGKE
jgi:hypothetical protein